MKYQVLDSFKAVTTRGEMELQAGQIVSMTEDKAIQLIMTGKVKPVMPYITHNGDLVIPFECDPKYHWWNSGQSIEETRKELSQ